MRDVYVVCPHCGETTRVSGHADDASVDMPVIVRDADARTPFLDDSRMDWEGDFTYKCLSCGEVLFHDLYEVQRMLRREGRCAMVPEFYKATDSKLHTLEEHLRRCCPSYDESNDMAMSGAVGDDTSLVMCGDGLVRARAAGFYGTPTLSVAEMISRLTADGVPLQLPLVRSAEDLAAFLVERMKEAHGGR